ncbi:CAAX prenyl protease 2 isoform X1 [Megalobrama amblycephala]|uniref:CAAX prenyl protease 2 isoform X1 n=1 Tax=Megalobrama amblycephala TaxID=75352 RepID=UPI002013DF13|nr:CAAX prenyl protease 2 isoform X1 [Megalobrama amblycephala]
MLHHASGDDKNNGNFGFIVRDHPNTIKRRFISVLCVSAVSPLVVLAWTHYMKVRPSPPLWALLGIRLEGFLPATLLPLTLTMVLFLGPLTQLAIESPRGLFHDVKTALNSRSWSKCVKDLRWLRNHVVAPLTEEFVFRACMIPMLVPCIGPTAAIFISPLFFGVAHFHHIIEQLHFGQDTVFEILICAAFQFTYTSIFGAYTAFIFIRTGHLVGPVLCHSFCNWMGFPAIGSVLLHPQRPVILFFYQMGVLLFLILLFPFTDPAFYGMSPICSLLLTPRSACT